MLAVGVVGLVASAGRLAGDGGLANQAAAARPTLGASHAARAADATIGEWRTAVDFGREEEANAVAVQPDGKVVVAGTSRSPAHDRSWIVVTRHLPDGALDPSFGSGGRVIEDVGQDSNAEAVLLLPDGQVVVAGAAGDTIRDPGMAVLQYLPDGSRDNSFGEGDGFAKISSVEVSPGDTLNECLQANAIARQPDDKLVVVGSVSCGGEAGGPSVAVARLRPDGALDSSFEYGGTHVIDFGHSTVAASVAVTSNGRILLGADDEGGYDNGSPLRVAGLRQDGSLDRGFGRRGRLRIDVPQRPDAFVGSIQLDPVGRLVLIGTAGGGHQPSTIVVARVTRTGHLDRRFGHAGISVAPTGLARSLWGWHGTLLPDGRIVVVGSLMSHTWSDIHGYLELLARIVVFRSDGALDPTVGTGGLRGLSFRPGRNGAHAVAVDPTDGLIVAGSTNHGIPTSFDIGLARVSLDP